MTHCSLRSPIQASLRWGACFMAGFFTIPTSLLILSRFKGDYLLVDRLADYGRFGQDNEDSFQDFAKLILAVFGALFFFVVFFMSIAYLIMRIS